MHHCRVPVCSAVGVIPVNGHWYCHNHATLETLDWLLDVDLRICANVIEFLLEGLDEYWETLPQFQDGINRAKEIVALFPAKDKQ